MRKARAPVSSARILFFLLSLALVGGMLLLCPPAVLAQHKIDPETWIKMRKMMRDKGPIPTIEDDVAALAGSDSRRAGPRLIDRGPDALPAVHSALMEAGVAPQHALRLLQVIGSIGEKQSVPVVLEFLERDRESPLRREALLILALLPATEEAAAFMIHVAAAADETWNTRRMAFTWFGLHRDPRGRPYARALLSDPDPERRSAGLFVLARLGDKTVLEPLSKLLKSGPPANSRDILMLALAEITSPDEFILRAPSSLAWSRGYKDALLYARYRAAGPQEKIPLCREMLRSRTPGHLGLAVRCLLEGGHAEDLRPYAALDLEAPGRDALIRNEIRKAGWRIIDKEDEFRIEPAHSGGNSQ